MRVKTIEVGDVVEDASGRKMTVTEVRPGQLNYPITCEWVDADGVARKGEFQVADVEYENTVRVGKP